jgi:hypothetical protein
MVEPRRKHGSFDPRYPALSTPAIPTWVLQVDAGLEWTQFLTRFFPGRRRHDIEALAAYGAYRNTSTQRSVDERTPPGPPPLASLGATIATRRPKRLRPVRPAIGNGIRRVPANALSAALSVWEGEGGAAGPDPNA